MILLGYDVSTEDPAGQKRLHTVAKICESYGLRVQNSLFELVVTPAQLVALKAKVKAAMDEEKDSVRLYQLGANWERKVEVIGRKPIVSHGDVFIL